MSLYQRVRPASFDDVVGNTEVVSTLRSLASQEEPPHAVLLVGPSGCGKTTMGRIFMSALGIVGDDYREVDSAQFRGIDTIRELREGAGYVALHGSRRGWLLDEVHQLTKIASDGLLKSLEDPPAHCYFVLCTTAPEALSETIRSRCSTHRVAPLSESDCVRLLHRVASGEGEKLPRPQLRSIWERTEGKPRAAIQLLEKVLAADPEQRDAVVAAAEAVRDRSDSLARLLMGKRAWREVAAVLAGIEEDDVESVRRGIMGYCSKVLLGGENERAMVILDQMVEPFFSSGRAGLVHASYLIVSGG